MFYWIYSYLDINIFQYISIRAGIGFFIAFFLTLFLMPKFIRWAQDQKKSQPIYEHAPDSHKVKNGTPTMGGLVFVVTTLVATIFTAKLDNLYVIAGMLVIALFALLGIKDDLSKITNNKNSAGLTPKQKLFFQTLFSALVIIILYIANHTTTLFVPFYKFPLFDMGVFAFAFWILVMVATSNAVNLTDGLDGLAVVPSIVSFFTLSAIVYITGNAVISGYLLLPNIQIAGELSIVGASFIGALIAFLWYNSHPAQVFMGDTGSLAIGGFLGFMAIVGKSEILLLAIGFLFFMETVSVILQVGSFKIRQKRVFLMAPIHHHFEEKGWHENKVTIRFWIIAFMSNLVAILTLKIR